MTVSPWGSSTPFLPDNVGRLDQSSNQPIDDKVLAGRGPDQGHVNLREIVDTAIKVENHLKTEGNQAFPGPQAPLPYREAGAPPGLRLSGSLGQQELAVAVRDSPQRRQCGILLAPAGPSQTLADPSSEGNEGSLEEEVPSFLALVVRLVLGALLLQLGDLGAATTSLSVSTALRASGCGGESARAGHGQEMAVAITDGTETCRLCLRRSR